jgi:uncharacterized protein (TIGR02145 family)
MKNDYLNSYCRLFKGIIVCILLANFQVLKGQGETKIGNQVWATMNLDVKTFRNGDTIHEAKTYAEWKKYNKEGIPAWCYYNNESANGKIYGKMYNWYAIIDKRGLAPEGWHIPSSDEWDEMIDFLGGKKQAGGKLKSKEWEGDNSSGFNAQPGGVRQSNTGVAGEFIFKGEQIWWWSTTPGYLYNMHSLSIRKTWIFKTKLYVGGLKGGHFCYVRCVKDFK